MQAQRLSDPRQSYMMAKSSPSLDASVIPLQNVLGVFCDVTISVPHKLNPGDSWQLFDPGFLLGHQDHMRPTGSETDALISASCVLIRAGLLRSPGTTGDHVMNQAVDMTSVAKPSVLVRCWQAVQVIVMSTARSSTAGSSHCGCEVTKKVPSDFPACLNMPLSNKQNTPYRQVVLGPARILKGFVSLAKR